jgi:iron complex outermembrane recepter protein
MTKRPPDLSHSAGPVHVWMRSFWLAVPFVVATAATAAPSGAAQPGLQDLKQLSIEQLMNVDVTLTARQAEPLARTPAAVSVVTAEDIRRSGVTSIPDAVALADGVQSARFNNGTWSITARGFNAVTANKMLVMIDGRTVYSPLFSGVFWNAVDYTLEDIERIEVVRGPGATLWGANAVNGVINILTRHARDSRGAYVQVGGGNEDPGLVDARYGGGGGALDYRLYAKFAVRGSQKFTDGSSAGDRRQRGQVGFRVDRGRDGESLMVKGDTFFSSNDFPDRADGTFAITDVQARWQRRLSGGSDLQLQSYLNHERREIPQQLTHHLTTFDVDAQHVIRRGRHDVVWGGGVRVNHDSTEGTPVLSFSPAARTYSVVNGFVQDEVALVPGRAYVTGGIKVERNAFTGVEVQPGVRARVMPTPQQMIWGSIARANRRPTRFDHDIRVSTVTGLLVARGNPAFEPERLLAAEAGYRVQPSANVSVDITLFTQRLNGLRSQEAPASAPPIPIVVGNTLNGRATGIELALTVQPMDWWRAHLAYTGQSVSITRDADSRDVGRGTSEANDPPHQFALRNSFDLPRRFQLDARLRSVAALPNPVVPRYTEVSARLAWRSASRVELALTGEDLLHSRHAEFNPTARGYEEFERSVRGTVTLWIR